VVQALNGRIEVDNINIHVDLDYGVQQSGLNIIDKTCDSFLKLWSDQVRRFEKFHILAYTVVRASHIINQSKRSERIMKAFLTR
jgi:hypothetical protein